ncbi:MAG TPA: CRISPR-associated endonuclease Cas2 [Desulfobacteraceae bacterium]|mgnify:CR=1 FL=1|nr:CRISPR-associated endonuclease Cas2 [Desulfobacteraceae bacterium]
MANWLVLYDIRNAKRLQKVAKVMEGFGSRVQKSVFEMSLRNRDLRVLRKKIQRIIEVEDFVAYFKVCQRDWEKRRKFGPVAEEPGDNEPFLII